MSQENIPAMSLFNKKFVIFKPLSHFFEETIGFDVTASFTSRSLLRLIRWYNKPGDVRKEFWEKAIQFHGTFHGLKITNCKAAKSFFCRNLELWVFIFTKGSINPWDVSVFGVILVRVFLHKDWIRRDTQNTEK